MLTTFTKRLQKRLANPLPGHQAQRTMMPAEASEERFNLKRQQNARLGGVLILFYMKEGEIYLPLTQRHEYGGTHSGQVSLPGGKWEEGDLDIVDTALRETEEEVGVPREDVHVLGRLTDLYIPPSNFRVTPVVGYVSYEPLFVPEAKEVKELIETPLALLRDKSTLKSKHITVRGKYQMEAPYYDVHGKVVWGATAMILSELMSVAEDLNGL